MYVRTEGCTVYFSWATAAACPVQEVTGDISTCQINVPSLNFTFNLKPLSKNGGYTAQAKDDGGQIKVSIVADY